MTCPSCGTELPAGSRFCPSCGQPVTARTDERRVATVLFGDLVGFTSLSESRDPEQVKNLVDHCFEQLAADIVSHGGRVDKIVGDAIVALFGAPIAHEDDAERAVRAGLAMQATMDRLTAEGGWPVQMRIGINTGEVLVGAIRAGDDYTAMGDVVNSASRLQSAAEPGQVLVGPDTHHATSDVITYEPVGHVEVKGRAAIETWRALQPVSRPGRRRRLSEGCLVGRDPELAILCSVIERVATYRRAQVIVLSGDAGVGKSRLASEMAAEAARQWDAFVLEGHCVPYGEANVWFPLAEALQQACGIGLDDDGSGAEQKCRDAVLNALGVSATPDQVDAIVASFQHLMGMAGPLDDLDPARARDEVTLGLHRALTAVAAQHPVMIVLSDVHWADDHVLALIDELSNRMAHEQIVLVLTARPGLDERWRPAPGPFNRLHLHLDPLPAAASAELLRGLIGDIPDDVAATLIDRSGGNPFFLEELAALVSESGSAPAVPGSIGDLPATLRGLVAARLDQLDPVERAVLEDAAVIGRRGTLDLLTGLAPSGGPAERRLLISRLTDRDLLVVSDGEFEFRTDLVREVAYSTLTKAVRAQRHLAVAEALEARAERSGRREEHSITLAHHYAVAAELATEVGRIAGMPADLLERALRAVEVAAERADMADQPLVLGRLCDQALRLLPDHPGIHRWRALIGRAKAAGETHDLDQALDDARTAAAEARAAGNDMYTAKARTIEGNTLAKMSRYDEAADVLAEAVALFERVDDPIAGATALRYQGFNDLMRGRLDDADTEIRLALERYRAAGNRRGEAWALQNLAWIAFLHGQPDVAEGRLTRAADTFEEVGDQGGVGWALGLLAWVRFQQGRLDEAEELARVVLPSAHERGERWAAGILSVLLSQISLWRGRPDEGVAEAERARRAFDVLNDRYGSVQALVALSRNRAASGDLVGAWEACDELAALAEGDPSVPGFALGLRESVATFLGDTERFGTELVDLPVIPHQVGIERLITRALFHLQRDEVASAVTLIEQAAPAVAGDGVRCYLAGVAGMVMSAAGRLDDARGYLAEPALVARGTYLDSLIARSAGALVAVRAGERDEAVATIDGAVAAADATGDVVSQAVVRLARSVVLAAAGRADAAAAARDDAVSRSAAIGLPVVGWETAHRLAAGLSVPDRATPHS